MKPSKAVKRGCTQTARDKDKKYYYFCSCGTVFLLGILTQTVWIVSREARPKKKEGNLKKKKLYATQRGKGNYIYICMKKAMKKKTEEEKSRRFLKNETKACTCLRLLLELLFP